MQGARRKKEAFLTMTMSSVSGPTGALLMHFVCSSQASRIAEGQGKPTPEGRWVLKGDFPGQAHYLLGVHHLISNC